MQQDVSREHTINNGSSMADHDEHPIEQKEFYMLIGLDIGGTKIEICVLDKQGSMLYRQRIATPDNYSQFVDCVCSLIVDAEQATQPVDSIGIGLPGAVSPVTGLIKMPIVPSSMGRTYQVTCSTV